jgi:ligand-binding sensor domain-containing protein/two-component sensor histidine kinase
MPGPHRLAAESRCRSTTTLAWSLCLISWFGLSIGAQILPIKNFATRDGLPHNNVNSIFQDAKGYLWIATDEGLSRFDGYTFTNYGRDAGLGNGYINDMAADRDGRLWVAVYIGGIAMFLDERPGSAEGKRFRTISVSPSVQSNNVNHIIFDGENRMWCATEGGIYRARRAEVASDDFDLVHVEAPRTYSRSAFVDRRGRLWFGLFGGVLRVDGERLNRSMFDRAEGYAVGIAEDQNGRIFVATDREIFTFDEAASRWTGVPISLADGQVIKTIGMAEDGGVWIGTTAGLIHYRDGRQITYSTKHGLASNTVQVIYRDREDGLWLGTYDGGLSNRANAAIVNFPIGENALASRPVRIGSDADGSVYIQTGCPPELTQLLRISDDAVSALPFAGVRTGECGRNYFHRASDGRWWFNSPSGLRVADRPEDPGVQVRLPDGNIVEKYLELYEATDGRVWLSAADKHLYVADGGQGGSPRFELAVRDIGASLMLFDSGGTLWLGKNTFLARYRDGNTVPIPQIEGVETIQPRALFEDSGRRVWIGTRFDGVLYTDEPGTESPRFKRLTTKDGLASNTVWSIAEDNAGGIYLGTGRGVDRFDIGTGRIRHFTSADGVPEATIRSLRKDTSGRIWAASGGSVTRIDPAALRTKVEPPSVYISGVTIEGDPLALAESGVSSFASPDLSANQNNVSIRFVSPKPGREHSLNYQYKLEGYDQDWSPPSTQREVTLANLGAGSYRFLVKAVDERGIESESPAVLQFQILPPFSQRWWFLTLVVIALGVLLYALYRYRLSRVIELERVRTRIATDLHDDIGSNLTRIALMSEVLNQQRGQNGSAKQMLPSIANIARESVASMNDIVWAISPEHDRVLDLTRRMRRHAEEVFTSRDIDLTFVSDSSDSKLKLTVGVRRDVLLIFKEAVNNAARHSHCTKVEIDFGCRGSILHLRIADNGIGFVENPEHDGHGLSSMARRAESLGGKLTIRSSVDDGTIVSFEMPLDMHR